MNKVAQHALENIHDMEIELEFLVELMVLQVSYIVREDTEDALDIELLNINMFGDDGIDILPHLSKRDIRMIVDGCEAEYTEQQEAERASQAENEADALVDEMLCS